MALSPFFAGRAIGSINAPNTLEVYLDFVCPFSKRIFDRLVKEVLPATDKVHPGQVRFVFRHQIQPWHPQSTLVHEAAIAVARLNASAFLPYAQSLFDNQTAFFDLNVYDLSREQIYGKLADLAVPHGIDRAALLSLLARVPSTEFLNTGNAVTNELKVHIRIARQNGIHVSPTCLWNGLADNEVSSGWDGARWAEFFKEKIDGAAKI